MTTSSARRRHAVTALAIAAGLALAPVAATSAYAGAAASAPVFSSTDAAAPPALHVGVRQAAVGDPIPVTIVGAEAGTVWEVAVASRATVVGTVTIGDDGTGTTLVALPLGTDAGSVEFTATAGGERISSSLSSAGDTAATDGEAETPVTAAEPAAPELATPVVVGIVAAAALALAGVAAFFALRRRRGVSA